MTLMLFALAAALVLICVPHVVAYADSGDVAPAYYPNSEFNGQRFFRYVGSMPGEMRFNTDALNYLCTAVSDSVRVDFTYVIEVHVESPGSLADDVLNRLNGTTLFNKHMPMGFSTTTPLDTLDPEGARFRQGYIWTVYGLIQEYIWSTVRRPEISAALLIGDTVHNVTYRGPGDIVEIQATFIPVIP